LSLDNLPCCKDALVLPAAFLPADLIDFVFELLSEPFGFWDKLRPVDFISRNQLELLFDGGPDLASGSQKASNSLLAS
jgi:hypothetical protein